MIFQGIHPVWRKPCQKIQFLWKISGVLIISRCAVPCGYDEYMYNEAQKDQPVCGTVKNT